MLKARSPHRIAEVWLRRLLRLGALVLLLAFPAMLLPAGWMTATHAWLGLGSFPAAPIVFYLSRSIAALYGFHGVLLWMVSGDLVRYRPIVVYVGVMNMVFGVSILAIDVLSGLPWYWVIAEGPPVTSLGVVFLALVRHVPHQRAVDPDGRFRVS
jgi:hypothetical protein